jgi:hypothetical protein
MYTWEAAGLSGTHIHPLCGPWRFKTVFARVRQYSLTSDGPSSTSADPVYILGYIWLFHFIAIGPQNVPCPTVFFLPKIRMPCVRCILHASSVAFSFDLIILIICSEEYKIIQPFRVPPAASFLFIPSSWIVASRPVVCIA